MELGRKFLTTLFTTPLLLLLEIMIYKIFILAS